MLRALLKLCSRYLATGLLTALSIAFVAYLAYKSSSDKPPTAGQATLLAVLSGVFQLWAAAIGSGKGRADENFVRSAVGRLTSIGVKVRVAELAAQRAYESGTAQSRRETLGTLSVTMSYLQEETESAIQDWKNLHPDAVNAMTNETGQAAPTVQAAPEVTNA